MEYTIEITQFCPNSCDYCSTNATMQGEPLPLFDIFTFLEEHKVDATDRINISGGEPLSHPRFYEILQLCKSKTANVWVYTNALTNIKYNANVLTTGIKVEANICLSPNCFNQSITIPKGIPVNLLKFIATGRGKDLEASPIHISGNLRDDCLNCEHILLQADGQIVKAPCQKQY